MRVTEQSIATNVLYNLKAKLSEIERRKMELSTSLKIRKPSDDPQGARRALALRQRLAANQQYKVNTADGRAWVARTESVLQSVSDSLGRIQTWLQQGANDTQGADERRALAAQLDAALSDIVDISNGKFGGRYLLTGIGSSGAPLLPTHDVTNELFTSAWDAPVELGHAGLRPSTVVVTPVGGGPAFTEGVDYTLDADTGTITVLSTGGMADATNYRVDYETEGIAEVGYAALSEGVPILRQVGDNSTYNVVISADEVYQGSTDIFQAIVTARDALLRNDQAGISAGADAMEDATDQVVHAIGRAGSIIDRLDRADEDLVNSEFLMSDELKKVQETDLGEAVTALQNEEIVYQAILGLLDRTLVQPSLQRFLS